MSFASLQLHPLILKALLECNYTAPFPVQSAAIPLILEHQDLMVSAQTGTGKTAAFMLPALQLLLQPRKVQGRGPRVLVLSPTRELAAQITAASAQYGKYLPKNQLACILGGMPYPRQIRSLSRTLDILVATPGRLIDHIKRGRLDFSSLELFVLDEADRMLDLGFIDDVRFIADSLPKKRQTLLFSATLGSDIARLAKRLLYNPKTISVLPTTENHLKISHQLHYVRDLIQKRRVLEVILNDPTATQVLVFTGTKRNADQLADRLQSIGHSVAALHGDMSQAQRNQAMDGARVGQVRVLVATDVAARGIDLPNISHVVNFDLPNSPEDYVHRTGRTGRAGASGTAISFATIKERLLVKRIERFTGQTMVATESPNFPPLPATVRSPERPRTRNSNHRQRRPQSRQTREAYSR